MIEQFAAALKKAKTVTFITGAGMSTESGIPDFRSSNGVYKNGGNLEKLLSKGSFERKPKEFWKVYKDIFNIKLAGNYLPNAGHNFLVDLERMDKKVTIVTQNVDSLHSKAGSTTVHEVHGNIQTAFCPKCKLVYDLEHIDSQPIPRCTKDNFILKPSVVLFGDDVKEYNESLAAVLSCDMLIALGSSLEVRPISGFPLLAGRNPYQSKDFTMAIINYEETSKDSLFDIVIHAGIGETLDKVYDLI